MYSLEPINVNKTCWYYEERKGLVVVQEARHEETRELIATTVETIPWAKLEASVRRHQKQKKRN